MNSRPTSPISAARRPHQRHQHRLLPARTRYDLPLASEARDQAQLAGREAEGSRDLLIKKSPHPHISTFPFHSDPCQRPHLYLYRYLGLRFPVLRSRLSGVRISSCLASAAFVGFFGFFFPVFSVKFAETLRTPTSYSPSPPPRPRLRTPEPGFSRLPGRRGCWPLTLTRAEGELPPQAAIPFLSGGGRGSWPPKKLPP